MACELGHVDVVQCLIDARASIDDPEPLRIACEYGNDKVALLLIQAGASLGRRWVNRSCTGLLSILWNTWCRY